MTRTRQAGVVLASAFVAAWILTPERAPGPSAPEPALQLESWAPIEIEYVETEKLPDPAPEPPEPPPQPDEVESRPEPPPPPKPPGIPAQQPEPPVATPANERGAKLLEAGVFPQLRATYRRIGFEAYRDAMLELGAGFFLFDEISRQPIAEIDPRTGATRSRELRAGLSRWPRDVTRHLPQVLERGRRRWGERASRVILLPPARVDAVLLGALDAHLRATGQSGNGLLGVDVAYEIRNGRLGCEVMALQLRDGTRKTVALRVNLG